MLLFFAGGEGESQKETSDIWSPYVQCKLYSYFAITGGKNESSKKTEKIRGWREGTNLIRSEENNIQVHETAEKNARNIPKSPFKQLL